MPESLRHLFCLPGLRADCAGVAEVEGQAVAGHVKVYPRIRCLPMGWTHALWACQQMHESIVRVGDIGVHNLLIDGKMAPPVKPFVHTQYVDNFICLSQDAKIGHRVADQADTRLRERGLPTHGVEHSIGGTTLGWTFDSKRPRMYVSRAAGWKLILALQELCRKGRASGRELSVVVGHYTMRSLIRRELLSVFFSTYGYIQSLGNVVGDLWPSVKEELHLAAALIPLAFRDLDAEVSCEVSVFDASSWGAGVLTKMMSRDEVEQGCAYSDRWRFTRHGEEAICRPRDAVLAESQGSEAGVGEVMPIPQTMWSGRWKRAVRKKWTRDEPQAILEARAGLLALRHISRRTGNLGKMHLLFSDAMTFVLSATKGRSSSWKMNRILRCWGALSLAGRMYTQVRWIASEQNAADSMSRGGNSSFLKPTCSDGGAEGHLGHATSGDRIGRDSGSTRGERKDVDTCIQEEVEVSNSSVRKETQDKSTAGGNEVESSGQEMGRDVDRRGTNTQLLRKADGECADRIAVQARILELERLGQEVREASGDCNADRPCNGRVHEQRVQSGQTG
eukprot:4216256-Amphidinium_carterae.2